MNTTTLNMTTLDGGVIIKKGTAPAPPSGGESGDWEYEYFALTDGWGNDLGVVFYFYGSLVKTSTSGIGKVIVPLSLANLINNNTAVSPTAVAIDMSLLLSMQGEQVTIKDALLAGGITEEILAKYRITKEEFYTLD